MNISCWPDTTGGFQYVPSSVIKSDICSKPFVTVSYGRTPVTQDDTNDSLLLGQSSVVWRV